MSAFFEGVGAGDTAGVWQETPVLRRPEFKARYAKTAAALRARRTRRWARDA